MLDSTYIGETLRGGPEKKFNQDIHSIPIFEKKSLPGAVVRFGNAILAHTVRGREPAAKDIKMSRIYKNKTRWNNEPRNQMASVQVKTIIERVL